MRFTYLTEFSSVSVWSMSSISVEVSAEASAEASYPELKKTRNIKHAKSTVKNMFAVAETG